MQFTVNPLKSRTSDEAFSQDCDMLKGTAAFIPLIWRSRGCHTEEGKLKWAFTQVAEMEPVCNLETVEGNKLWQGKSTPWLKNSFSYDGFVKICNREQLFS